MDAPRSPAPGPTDPTAAQALLDQLEARIHDRVDASEAAEVAAFARRYWGQVAAEDLAERALDDLYGAALSHWNFARSFQGGAPRLRVYNPRSDEHGWQSTHTVIEIVNDDMPFLVDSVTMEVNRQGLTMHLIVHPVMRVSRDAQGRLQSVRPERVGEAGRFESLIHVEVDRRTDPGRLDALRQGLLDVLADVRSAVTDWQPMRAAMLDAAARLRAAPPAGAGGDLDEELAFLEWLADGHFTLLGAADFEAASDDPAAPLQMIDGSGLGILREGLRARAAAAFAGLPAALRASARGGSALLLTKASRRSTVHRPGHLDYLAVQRVDEQGRFAGERRFLGMFTSVAYYAKPADIPLLRRKVQAVVERAGFMPRSHMAKALATIVDQYPRDELFQIEVDELHRTAMGILRLGERQRTRLFLHRDAYGRFASCLIYVPREHYNTDLRTRMQALLMEALDGESSEFSVQFTDSPLARVLIVVHSRGGAAPEVDVAELERRLVSVARRWEDALRDALIEACGEERGNLLHERYAAGFAPGYRDDHGPRAAVHDIELMESLAVPDAVAMKLYRPLEAAPGRLRFKLLRAGHLAPLSQSLPMLERMGVQVLEERPYEVRRGGSAGEAGGEVWIDDFGLALPAGLEVDLDGLRGRFQEAFERTWRGDNDNDDFNALVLLAGLDWRGVSLLRAYMRYMRQAGFSFTRAYIQQALAAHPAIAADLVALFQARFDPDFVGDRAAAQAAVAGRVQAALEDVANLDEDRILRQYLAMIEHTLRTNFFQRGADGGPKPVLSFKFDGRHLPGLPEPRPMFEIFVSSPRVEGTHLRFGKVARGGLRWSDRMEDFRTEILGLVKAQQVKNVVIVPVGSKGGFVVRQPPPAGDREALMAEGVACYRLYLGGLLDLTDNRLGDQVVPPPRVVRHDEDDPYLVVAADKGTATFSDIANATAAEYGFWLGDAFASGGSVGYDHKKMGITARGAWESVKTHFRSLGHDTQTQDFTVVGVGDMSGDVFGNGMLLSRHIRLVAAFDHRHIFVDPTPDAAASHAERERLFALPRSSWDDYDRQCISPGGGVWPRSAKSIAVTAPMRAALGLDDGVTAMTPSELMRAILLAPVDLFYNGGIGTYFKASTETHADCGDRANDAIRVDGRDLRCKVFAEGGNLGATQRGRIEFALKGGLLNTDAIDNSAGVDCSDHEVNIKILLGGVVAEGELTLKQRDKLLAEMTDDVARLCLRDNTFQNQVLAVTREAAPALLEEHARYMRHLAAAGRLSRKIEFLPHDEAIAERRQAGLGLTAPEIAVLLAYHKMELYDEVLASDVPDDPYIATALARYFPARVRERFAPQLERHPLKREIVTTHVTNSMVNRVGPSFVHRLREQTGAESPDIVRAYLGTRQIFDFVTLWLANEALDHQVPMAVQNEIVRATVRVIERGTVWLLQHRQALADLAATIRHFEPGVAEVGAGLERWLAPAELDALHAATARLQERGVPAALAQRVARLEAQAAGLDIVEVAEARGVPLETVAGVYFGVGGRLALGWLSQQAAALPADSHWAALARVALRSDVSALARELAGSVLRDCESACEPGQLIERWAATREFKLARCRRLIEDLQAVAAPDLAMLSVLVRELRSLV